MSRIVVDIASNKILQVEKTPEVNESRVFNGRFALPIPEGSSVDVDDNTFFFPQSDPESLTARLAGALLARFPMYENIVYNFFVESDDINELDEAILPAVSSPGAGLQVRTRAQTGRGSDIGAPTGNVANRTALLPQNNATPTARPGMLVTKTVDIAPFTGGAGADEFLMWWYIYSKDTSEDIASDFGIFAGENDPAYANLTEIDQEPAPFQVYISHDDGATWTSIGRLEPTDLVTFDTNVRVLFVNTGNQKVYLGAYAFMF